jgi:hypothetical protein
MNTVYVDTGYVSIRELTAEREFLFFEKGGVLALPSNLSAVPDAAWFVFSGLTPDLRPGLPYAALGGAGVRQGRSASSSSPAQSQRTRPGWGTRLHVYAGTRKSKFPQSKMPHFQQ